MRQWKRIHTTHKCENRENKVNIAGREKVKMKLILQL